jgi:hypothetical protein
LSFESLVRGVGPIAKSGRAHVPILRFAFSSVKVARHIRADFFCGTKLEERVCESVRRGRVGQFGSRRQLQYVRHSVLLKGDRKCSQAPSPREILPSAGRTASVRMTPSKWWIWDAAVGSLLREPDDESYLVGFVASWDLPTSGCRKVDAGDNE